MSAEKVATADLRGPVREFVETWRYRSLIGHLVRQELATRYNRSVLGWLWSVLHPLSTLLVYSLVFGTILRVAVPVGAKGLDSFTLFFFSGFVVWNLFNQVSSGVMRSFDESLGLRHRVYFPPACTPLARLMTTAVVSSVEVVVMIAAFASVGVIGATVLSLIPILVLMGVFAFGLGLLLSVPNVRFRDVGHLYGVFLNFLFFLTPIIYPLSLLEGKRAFGMDLETLIRLNPLTHFVDAMRRSVYVLEWPPVNLWLNMIGSAAVMVALGWFAFVRWAPDAAEGR